MARGTPDYNPSSSQYGQQSTDVAELAARMRSIDVLERKGSVIFIEDFSGLLANWYPFASGGGSVNPVANHALRSPVSIRLIGDANIPDGAMITRRLPIISNGRYGVEVNVSLAYDAVNTPADFLVRVRHYTGSILYQWQLRYKSDTQRLDIMTGTLAAPVYVTLPVLPGIAWMETFNLYYNYVKMVYDTGAYNYGRFLFNSYGGDLSAYSAATGSNTTNPHDAIFLVANSHAVSQAVYFSDLIITIDEP